MRYVYDPLGRLVAVVDDNGGAAVYTYDAVGNLVSIQRIAPASASVAVAITLVSPNHGVPGATIRIFGKGFASSIGQNAVSFNGEAATVLAATQTALTVAVPAGASSGLISVTAPLGSADSPTPFRVVGPVTVTPASATLLLGTAQPFTANEGGTPTSSVRWSVNGVAGGNATIGTISGTGVYTAPASLGGAPTTVTIAARHQDDPTVVGSASLTILQFGFSAAAHVSVALGTSASIPVNEMVGTAVSVVMAGSQATLASARPVSVGLAPTITDISPAAGTAGTAGLVLTLNGHGFEGATAVSVLRNNAVDPAVSVDSFSVDATGTIATVELSIASNAAPGGRVLQITTPSGVSSAVGVGGNAFTIE